VLLEVTVEKSDHDSYCSGDECIYSKHLKHFLVDTSTDLKLKSYIDNKNDLNDYDWVDYIKFFKERTYFEEFFTERTKFVYNADRIQKYMEDTFVNDNGSGFCDVSQECIEKGLDRHDYIITIDGIMLDKHISNIKQPLDEVSEHYNISESNPIKQLIESKLYMMLEKLDYILIMSLENILTIKLT
jgi:hypothetical protein